MLLCARKWGAREGKKRDKMKVTLGGTVLNWVVREGFPEA